jgi:PTH1 family peptidyl-tRNA hydrolase
MSDKKLIVGLGNPGSRYENTRHNIGFKVLDEFVSKKSLSFDSDKKCPSTKQIDNNVTIYYLKPCEYMNLSGQCVSKIANMYKIVPQDILVVHDEIDFPFGKIKMKQGGGAAGHNGLKSIIEKIGDNGFHRLRFGVGRPTHPEMDVADFVLAAFTDEERKSLSELINGSMGLIESWIKK